MKGIIIFFTLAFLIFGGGVMFYETQIAGPRADAITQKSKKTSTPKADTNQGQLTNSDTSAILTPQVVTPLEQKPPSRVVDLNIAVDDDKGMNKKEQKALLKELDESVQKTIQQSINLEIQQAVAAELSKQAN